MKKVRRLNNAAVIAVECFAIMCVVFAIFNKWDSVVFLFKDAVMDCYKTGQYQEFTYAGYDWTVDYIPNGTQEIADTMLNTIKEQSDAWDEVSLEYTIATIGYFNDQQEAAVCYKTTNGLLFIVAHLDTRFEVSNKDEFVDSYYKIDKAMYKLSQKI